MAVLPQILRSVYLRMALRRTQCQYGIILAALMAKEEVKARRTSKKRQDRFKLVVRGSWEHSTSLVRLYQPFTSSLWMSYLLVPSRSLRVMFNFQSWQSYEPRIPSDHTQKQMKARTDFANVYEHPKLYDFIFSTNIARLMWLRLLWWRPK